MPISSADGRGKWKRRKRDPPIPQKLSTNEEDEEDNEITKSPMPESAPSPAELAADSCVRICEFPVVTKFHVTRPSSLTTILNLERARGHNRNNEMVPSLENISHGQLQSVSAVPPEKLLEAENAPSVISPPRIMEGKGVIKSFWNRTLVLPVHSDWFSPSIIHRLERQVVPHFFSSKSSEHTPEKYMECRNFIVAKYMVNAEKRIEVSDCRGLVAGIEDDDLGRIFRFLENWGIVNYSAVQPSVDVWNGSGYLKEDENGEVHVPSASMKSIDGLIKFEKPTCRKSVEGREEEVEDLDSKIRERLSENRCCYCAVPITGRHYQSQKEGDVMLCSKCFHEGRLVVGHSSLDFVREDSRKESGDLDGGDIWSDQETLLLLEAVEVFRDNWSDIADYVGSKTKAQCILHFLRVPMEYNLLDSIEIPEMSKTTEEQNNAKSKPDINEKNSEIKGDFPFENCGNPLIALIAFLAYSVGPRVAAACAHASLASLSDDGRSEDGSPQEGQREEIPTGEINQERVKSAAKIGLSAAAMKAKLFADHEEREIQRLSANIINHQLKRLELKLKQFTEIEGLLMRECEHVEKTRQRFAAERARLLASGMSAPSVGDASPQNRNQMGFVQRGTQQSVFPRLPLSSIQPPSSSNNPGFNHPASSQGNVNHMLKSVSAPRPSGLG